MTVTPLGEQDLNYHQLEKLKNEVLCLVGRRRCGLNHIEEEQQRNQPFLSFLQKAGQFKPSSALFVAHVHKVRIAPQRLEYGLN